jgi:hypothetical protein
MGVINGMSALRLENAGPPELCSLPKVSVLIPARNEEVNIKHLLQSWIKSDMKPYEILVLDDQSADRTAQVAEEVLSHSSISYRVIRGKPWSQEIRLTGKNHACQQLADAASGDVFLFCDADLTLSELALGRTLAILQTHSCAGITGLPRQRTRGDRERLVLPWILQLPLILTLPLRWTWQSKISSMQVANGQWLALWRDRYCEMGGHQGLGWEVLEDVAIARRMTQLKLGGILPVIASADLEVTMYPDWESLVEGFSKNLALIFGGSQVSLVVVLVITNIVFSFPLWGWFMSPAATVIGLILILGCRAVTGRLFRMRSSDLLLHWNSMILLNQLVWQVLVRQQLGPISWKGRQIRESKHGGI